MPQHGEQLIQMKVLIVDDELNSPTATGRAVQALVKELRNRGVEVIESISAADGESIIQTDSSLQCVLLDWDLKTGQNQTIGLSEKSLLAAIRSRNEKIPIFLFARPVDAGTMTAEVMRQADELICLSGRYPLLPCRAHPGRHTPLPGCHRAAL